MSKPERKLKVLAVLSALLNRVEMLEHRQQDDAYTVGIDRVTNTASVKVNPGLLDTEGQHKARIRGAAELMLSGFRSYNRDMTRHYGTWGNEQQTFDRAYDQAREQIEGLLGEAYPYDLTEPLELRDITPATPAQAPADQGQATTAQPPATDAGAVQAKDSTDNTSLLGNVPTPPTGVPTVNAPQMPGQAHATDSPAPDTTTVPAPVSLDFTEPQTAPATDNGSLTALPADATLNAPATDASATQPADTMPTQGTTDTSGQ